MRQESVNQIWAAELQGDMFACIAAGALIREGKVGSTNLLESYNKLAIANRSNCLLARDWLATMNNSNMPKSLFDHPIKPDAFEQLNAAANSGNVFAMVIIGIMAYKGINIVKNDDVARSWLSVAAQHKCLWAEDVANEIGLSLDLGNYSPNPSVKRQDTNININGIPVNTSSVFTPNDINTLRSEASNPTQSDEQNVDYVKELQSLIGLEQVKKDVDSLRNFVKAQKQREEAGLKTSRVSYHCVFTGNPGTGKTTVARIVAGIYKEMGVLKKGHLVECDRSDLVAEYTGQTAVKTNKKIDEALDGVLFIDEAYTLVQGGDGDFGPEAIATLLKRMEDDRHRLIVILAGYTKEIKQFINSNPGLESRFNRYIHFADYTADELKQIFVYTLNKEQYNITPEAFKKVEIILEDKVASKDARFGNARYVRNLFEVIIQRWADRVATKNISDPKELALITADDIIDL